MVELITQLPDAMRGVPLLYLLSLGTLLALVAAVVLRVLGNVARFGKTPPVFEGIPLVGGIIKFAKGPMKLMQEGYAKFGEVFTVPVAHKNITFLIGPQVSSHFFKATDDELGQAEVYGYCVPTFGKGVVYDVDNSVRAEQFKFCANALRIAKLKSYVPQFVKEAEDFFASWGEQGEVDLMEQFSELIILTASRTLLGREVRENLFRQVADLYHELDAGMKPISVLFPYLPIKVHRNRDRARDDLAAIFAKVVAARRANNVKEEDMLQVLIDSKYEKVYNGRMTNDKEICGLLIAMLFAGQHTSSITSSWTGLFMLANKGTSFAAAAEEQRKIMSECGSNVDMDVLNRMDVLHRSITEALRLFPPLIMVLRYVKQAFSVTTSDGKSYVIPKGNVVAASPAFAHRLPHLFKNADSFEPDRFAPPREEDKGTPFAFIGFGGGRHGCMGQNFAYLQIKTIWAVLLRNFDLEMIDPFPEPDYESMVVGPKHCRVRYQRRKL